MARVVVSVNVRDLTRGDLTRMRHNFRSLGEDLSRAVGERTRENFARLSQSVNIARRDLNRLRGNIPNSEFLRLDDAIRQSQRTLQRGFSNVGDRAFARVARQVREVVHGFQELDQASEISVRLDTTALRRADASLAAWRRMQEHRPVRVPVRVNTRQAESRIRRWAMGPLRGLGGLIGGTLSDGIGQGIMGAFKGSPVFGTIIVGAIVGALSLAGAAIAGALVFALGGAFVGLAAMSAAKSDEVQRNWKEAAKNMGEDLRKAGEPLIPVLHRAVHVLEGMSKDFAPHFREAMEKAAPHLDNFIVNTREGFRKMGQHAWDDLQEAFRVFLAAFGPEWEKFLGNFGKALGALARTVKEHSTEMAMALGLVLSAINGIINVINFFANAWVMGIQIAIGASATFIDSLGMVVDSFLGMVDTMLGALETVADLLGFGDEVAAARESFGQLRDDAVGKFTNMADSVRQMGVDMDYANRKRVLEVETASWNSQLTRALEKLKTIPPEQQTALRGEISDLRNKIDTANEKLRSMQKDYYVRIHAYKVGDWALGMGGPMAHGGVVGHVGRAATGGARSNMTLVGERGPEIVNLAPGSHVRSNGDSRRLAGQGDGGAAPTIVFKSSGRRSGDLLIELLREEIHKRGGDPFIVLGGNTNGR